MYYSSTDMFGKDQKTLNDIVDDIAFNCGAPRIHMHILTVSKGLVYGDLDIITSTGSVINCLYAETMVRFS